MSSFGERDSLLSERAFLTLSLKRLPATARLTRSSTESRLRAVTARLAALPLASSERLRVLLTFRGQPVIGSQGIFADFGAKAVASFSDAVAAVAASLNGGLAAMGPIPNRDLHQLMITGTAVGSFGFELQPVPQQTWVPAPQEPQGVAALPAAGPAGGQLFEIADGGFTEDATGLPSLTQALQHTHDLLQGTQEADDERLADAASDLDPRAIAKVRSFVSVLADHGALCAIDSGPARRFVFTDPQQVQLSLGRLSDNNVHERQLAIAGRFIGLLPGHRTFEFMPAESGDLLSGKVAIGVADLAAINRHLGELTTVQLVETRVGTGRPRFVLAVQPTWPALPAL